VLNRDVVGLFPGGGRGSGTGREQGSGQQDREHGRVHAFLTDR